MVVKSLAVHSAAISDQESRKQILKGVLSNLISSLSGGMLSFAMGLMLLNETHSPFSFSLGTIITPTVSLILLIPAGTIIDQKAHKPLLITWIIVRLGALIIFGGTINIFSVSHKWIPVIVFVAITAVANYFINTSYQAAVHELVNTKFVPRLSSLTQAATALASLLSPMLGVALYSVMGFSWFIYLEISSQFLVLLLLLSLHFYYESPLHAFVQKKSTSAWQGFRVGLAYLLQHSLFRDLIIIAMLVNFVFTAISIGMPFVLIDHLHAGNAALGYLETSLAGGTLMASLLLSMCDSTKYFLSKLIGGLAGSGLALIVLGIVFTVNSNLLLRGALVLLILGMLTALINVSLQVKLQTTLPTNLLGRITSLMTTACQVMMPLGALTYTFLFQISSRPALIFVISGGLLFLSIVLATPFLWHDSQKDSY